MAEADSPSPTSVRETKPPNTTGKLVKFGVSNDRAWEVGLSCGGEIEVFIEALPADGAEQGSS